MIEMKEDIRGIWFVQLTPRVDWLAAVREQPDGRCLITYRFRYYHSADPFDEHDKKSWYEGTVGGPTNDVLEKTSKIAAALAEKSGGEKYELIRGAATLDQFMEQFTALPFAHVKTIKPQEESNEQR